MNQSDVSQLVDALCAGDEDAYFTLIEADDDVVPLLMVEFGNAINGEWRAKILEVIWQHRLPDSVAFLAFTMNDEHVEVWKQALDGLVAIGGNDSKNALIDLLDRVSAVDERAAWISEAIDQIE